jgi:Tol biopolymer transport system component
MKKKYVSLILIALVFVDFGCKKGNVITPSDWNMSGKIVFATESGTASGIFLLDMSSPSLSLTKLNIDSSANSPQVSPDGLTIAFSAIPPQSDEDVYLIDITGGSAVDLTQRKSVHETDPAWSPDGSSIVFDAFYYQSGAICLMNRDGSNLHDITDSTSLKNPFLPRWSPNGNTIAFLNQDIIGTATYSLHTIAPDGSHQVLLDQELKEFYPPLWSPDSREIAYAKPVLGGNTPSGFHIIDVATFQSQKIGFDNVSILPANFVWLSSSSLVCVGTDTAGGGVYIVSIYPSLDEKRIASGFKSPPTISVSPDGKYVAMFGTLNTDGGLALYVVQADGTNFRRLKIMDQTVGWYVDPNYITWTR